MSNYGFEPEESYTKGELWAIALVITAVVLICGGALVAFWEVVR